LDKFKVPEKEKGEVLGALGPLKPAIVASPDKLHPIDDAKLAPAVKLAASMKDKEAAELLNYAITAAKRGQRNWADQLFSRAEMKAGAGSLASVAAVFRAGAPTRVAKHRVIEQRDKSFAPHVMAVPVGSTIEFPNYDQIFHNVFSLSKSKAFD